MKIPETSANVGAYYGNEENGQWQPNGVIIDSGVGGGVVGSGDAGLHRPVYPLHIPRGHVSGYVMAGTYYGPAGGGVGAGAAGYAQGPPPDDFADYMWMEHEEEFDKQVMQQLEEEALMEQCIEAMLEDEQRERHRPAGPHATASNGTSLSLEETVSRSTLNPLAAEFVPTRRAPATEDKTAPATGAPPADDPPARAQPPLPADTSRTEEAPTLDPPEVSAADVQPDIRREKKQENKKTLKQDIKKVKPVAVKSETKVQQSKKKEVVKTVKSESRVGEHTEHTHEPAIATHTPTDLSKPTPVSAPSAPSAPSEQLPAGPKPINYAAAAKANKPKKTPTPPTIEKTPPPAVEKKITEKRPKDKVEKAPTLKEKPARKNSAK